MEEQQFTKPALDKFRQWHFWWLVIFSLLLIVSFVYYLPTSFLEHAHEAESMPHTHSGETSVVDESQPHTHGGDTTASSSPSSDMMMGHDAGTEHDHTATVSGSPKPASSGQMVMDHTTATGAVYKEETSVTEGLTVNLNINPVPYKVGVPLSMNFFVNQKPGNVPVTPNQLQVEHEKLMHVIGVRSDMNGFFHIHPQPSSGNTSIFTVNHTFDKPGLYKIWSEIKKEGVNYSFGHPEVNVSGSGIKEEKKVSFSRNVTAGNYQVSLKTSDSVVKGKEVSLSLDVHSSTGKEVDVENYLGAQMHLVLIKDDLKQFIHAHPEGHVHAQGPVLVNQAYAHGDEVHTTDTMDQKPTTDSADMTIDFKVTIPEAGLYKAYAQFRPQGIDLPVDDYLLAEFWIQVEEKAPFPVSQWWGLLAVSAVLMAGLSWIVNNYLKVKPESIKIKK